ncbi:MAG: MaoC family dehydratase [Actinomycetota bacterium]|nr:MaoC family dehydratase [Actinomycetota bacterium]
MRTFNDLDEVKAAKGEKLGTSDWVTIEQERVNTFAEATGDHQWIHVDPEKAKDGPFGGPIAHGYLTLSLLPMLGWQTYDVKGARMAVNYGLNKLRFPAPVKVGSRVRASFELAEVEEIQGGLQMVVRATIEAEGTEKPVAVAETVTRVYA